MAKQFFPVLCLIFLCTCSYNPQVVITEEDWFAFDATGDPSSSRIDCSHWLDAPAGKHGFVQMDGDRLVFEDQTPVKFWGVNICSNMPYVEHQTADQWTDYLARYGVNSVRFHKFTSHGFDDRLSTDLVPEKYERMDYFHNKLREQGIYYSWSPIYGHKPKPGDKDRLLAYEEIAAADLGNHLSYSTIGLVNFAEDLQDLHIKLITNMLNHKNPYSGLRYADDPALAYIELQNEDDIYFATTHHMLNKCPTYRELLAKEFTQWLKSEYGNQEGLKKAWGDHAFEWAVEVFDEEWNIDEGPICPVADHGILSYEYSKACAQGEPMPKFLLDMAWFLYEKQIRFYDRFVQAIRSTGYKGAIVGSCWQAGSGPAHYYNLFADYRAGIIDRHNYYGGGTGHTLVPGRVNNRPMVSNPGIGILKTGLQAVADRPFSLSEWQSLTPNEWIAEVVPVVATYGMGLQGWDASFSFASNDTRISETVESASHGVYNVESPLHITQYPAAASMIYRGDVTEADIISSRNVHIGSLREGKLGFSEKVFQQGDFKGIQGDVSPCALAAGKVVLDFTEEYKETTIPDLSSLWDTVNKTISSSTGQLFWQYGDAGYITLNSPGTKLVAGFTSGKRLVMGGVAISVGNPFAVVYISCLGPGETIADADRLLITTLARGKNTGMEYSEDESKLVEVGHAPVLMEPVVTEVTIKRKGNPVVYVLDHAGRRTGEVIDADRGRILLDGRMHKTIYYEVVYGEQ